MAAEGDEWCLIESDPGVFTELLESLGCEQAQLEELWSLDDASLAAHGEIFGLIFLFQWQQQQQQPPRGGGGTTATKKPCLAEGQVPEGLFFAHQVTTNACATQAILSVLMNHPDLELGPTLTGFREFTASFPPSLKGVAISSSEPIRKAHNAFGRRDAFLHDGRFVSPSSRDSDDVYHFVAYVPKGGTVYELDGLRDGPIVVGEFGTTTAGGSGCAAWLSVAREAIQARMAGGNNIKFNLMAVVRDKRIALRSQASGSDPASAGEAALKLRMEDQKREAWRLENQRRRHNYVPLCVSMLRELAGLGKLEGHADKARERKSQRASK